MYWIKVSDGAGVPPPEPVLTVTGKVEPSPLVKVIILLVADAVIKNEPVFVDVPTAVEAV